MTGYFVAAGVLIGTGLLIDSRFPRPDQTAAAPAFVAADIAERQASEERYLRRITLIRLRELADQHDEDGEFGPKEIPAAAPGLTKWGAK